MTRRQLLALCALAPVAAKIPPAPPSRYFGPPEPFPLSHAGYWADLEQTVARLRSAGYEVISLPFDAREVGDWRRRQREGDPA